MAPVSDGSDGTAPAWDMTRWPGEEGWRRRPLYAEFFGLAEGPFDLTPNPRYLFLSARQREAFSNLRYSLLASKGFTLIVGEAGTGKTTLVRTALSELGNSPARYVLLNNPALNRDEFYEFLAAEFGLSVEVRRSKVLFLSALQRDVEARFAAGGLTGLIVDEAQSLSLELLEEIRLLGNIETATTKLLNIILCGQPELSDRLNDQSLRQLKQRIALRCELQPLSLEETAAYISARLRVAGGSPGAIFTRETVVAIHRASKGIPRTINVVCDNALIGGFAAQIKPVPVEVITDVCRDFDLDVRSSLGLARKPADAPARSAITLEPAPETTPTEAAAPGSPERHEIFSSITQPPKGRFRLFSRR